MRWTKFLRIGLCLLSFTLTSCTGSGEKQLQFNYTFDEDQQGWITDFADLPVDYDQEIYELDAGWGGLSFVRCGSYNKPLFLMFQNNLLKPLKSSE